MKLKYIFPIAIVSIFAFSGCDTAITKVVENPEPVEEEVIHEASAAPLPAELEQPTENPEVALAKCLTENGAKLYTASWCGHCKNQKEAFGDGIEYLDNTECAQGDGWAQACTDAGVKAVPTWIYGDGKTQTGNTPLATLAAENGCTYNN